MRRLTLICVALLFSPLALATESRSRRALTTEIQKKTFTAKVGEGFHFNEKAPNGLQQGTVFTLPKSVEKRKLVIDPLPDPIKGATAHLYVCDDEQTYCDIHRIELDKSVPRPKKNSKPAVSTLPGSAPTVDARGFLINDFSGALKIAKKEKKLILANFSAPWCPGCIRLDDEILASAEFHKRTERLVKVKIDFDVFTNGPVVTKYQIQGVPTLVFMNANGEEITRFYDYQPPAFVWQVFDEVEQVPLTLVELEKSAKTSVQKELLWRRYYYSGQYEKALTAMREMKNKPKEYWTARVDGAEEKFKKSPNSKDTFLNLLREALKSENDSTRSLLWRQKLIQHLPPAAVEVQALATDSNQLAQTLLGSADALKKALETDMVGEYAGFEPFYVASTNADTQELAAGDSPNEITKKAVDAAWKQAVDEGVKLKITANQPGAALRLISARVAAGQLPEALTLVDELLKKDGRNGDWLARRLNILVKLGKFKEAVTAGETALPLAYGVNEFSVAANLAEAYSNTGEAEKAKALADQYLARNEVNFKRVARAKARLEKIK